MAKGVDHHHHGHILGLLEGFYGHIQLHVLKAFATKNIEQFHVLEVGCSDKSIRVFHQGYVL